VPRDFEMMRNGIIPFVMVWFSLQPALAKDFEKSYSIPQDSRIIIQNFLGNIKLTGYKGKNVELTAYKKGPESDQIEINEDRGGDRIRIYSHDPQFTPPPLFAPPKRFGVPKEFPPREAPIPPNLLNGSKASVDFEIRIPQSIIYKQVILRSFGGKVDVSGVKGNFVIMSERGSVEVKNVKGFMAASSTSGTVSVYLEHATEHGSMSFSSISGNVIVRAPASLSAVIDMQSQNGLLKTDFPIEIREDRYGPGKYVHSQLGAGSERLLIRSNSGQVSLVHK
jgi:hypothetical protein